MRALLQKILRRLPEGVRSPLRGAWRRLPPADRRLLLGRLDDPRRRADFLSSAAYRAFIACEMAHWSAYQGAPAAREGQTVSSNPSFRNYRTFTDHPLALAEYLRRAAPGECGLWPWIGARAREAGGGEALVLGAGAGDHCRLLIDLQAAAAVTACDIAEGSVRRARAEFARLGYPIDYRVADLNFITLEAGRYDLCLAMSALHHIVELERLAAAVARALTPGRGLFIIEDYTGPRFVELPAAVRRLARELFAQLPERLRRERDGAPMRTLAFRDRWEAQRESPFEAIRSDRILECLREHFEIETMRVMGGGLMLALLSPLIHNFDPADDEANRCLGWIMDEDLALTHRGTIPNCFTFLVARPRQGC